MQNSILPIQRLFSLLTQEYESEKEDYRLQTESMSIERKVKRGICWYPIKVGRSYYNSLNQLVVEITQDNPQDIDHNFEYGRPVVFWSAISPKEQSSFNSSEKNSESLSTNKNRLKYFSNTCTISYVDGNKMVVVLPSSQMLIDLQNSDNIGVQLYFDETSFRTMFRALDDVIKSKGNRLSELRDIFSGQQSPSRFTFNKQTFPWLNSSQEHAVNEVLLSKDVSIVHGPPGTGKTTTLVEAIYETLKRETQVMVCCQSNMAVDWISEKLVDHGIPVLRIGNPTRVNDKMLSFTYERKFESHPEYSDLWAIRKTIREIREHKKKGDSIHQKISRLRDRASELEMRISSHIFDEARVISCTLVGSSSKLLVGKKFSTLFIDEAAQALEPACWIAIRRCHRVVLAGDHQQLPPTIKNYEAQKGGLNITLMERIIQNVPSVVTMLKIQYRMHEKIMQFSSDWFYRGEMVASPMVRNRSILDYDNPILWIDTSQMTSEIESEQMLQNGDSFKESFIGENYGRINKKEGALTIQTLIDYINKIGKLRFIEEHLDIGIISPYRVQAQYLRSLINKTSELKPYRKLISVNTIDGFQGQERDIILISLVRSNDQGNIGFLSDLRRMNVAMTRARMKLIIIGDASTLSHHPFYRRLFKYINSL